MNSHPSFSRHSKIDDGHNHARPETSALLQYLATYALERYLRRVADFVGSIDLAVSIDVFHVVKRLRPSSHPHRSDTLNNLAIAIFIRYKEGQRGSDLSRPITLHREALGLQQSNRSDHPSSATHLANALLKRLKRHGGDVRLSDIIDVSREWLNTHTREHRNQFQREQMTPANTSPSSGQYGSMQENYTHMHDTALSYLGRYQHEGEVALLTKSIRLFQNTLSLLSLGDPNRAAALNNFAIAMISRYERDGSKQDLSNVIQLHWEALSLRPINHPDRSLSLSNLAIAIITRYQRYGRVRDLEDVIKLYREALPLQPPSHPDYSVSLCNLANAIHMRYQREGREQDLLESIRLSDEALSLLPPGHPNRPSPLRSLASATLTRYERDGKEQDLHYVIDLNREALSLRPPGHHDRSGSLSCLANAIITRYERFGGESDLSDAIELHKDALSLQPPGRPGRFVPLNNLATALHTRFKRDGRKRDLSHVVDLHREALSLLPVNHPERSLSSSNLANALLTRYDQDGRDQDLLDVIELQREALSLRPPGHPDRSLSLSNLANAIKTRYNRDHEEQDLLEVIKLYKDALNLVPLGHLRHSGSLSNLGSAIRMRYERHGKKQDLSDVIELERKALSLRPVSHPERSLSLNNLANALLTRFQRDDIKQDLLDVIELHKEVLSLRPPGHSRRPSSLGNLANAIFVRYRRYGGERDLSDVIDLRREALSLLPPGHPGRSSALGGLADALLAGYGRNGGKKGSAFVEEIIQLLQHATAAGTSPITVRLHEALRWIDFAVAFDPNSALKAYRSAFSLLGSAMTLGRSLQARHSNLLSQGTRSRSTKGLALDAALWALTSTSSTSSHPKLAIELLDQGRNVLLASVGQFRVDLSDIRREDPALADEVYRTSQLLDSAVSRGQDIAEGKSTHEDSTSRYKRVFAKWEAVVAKIRLLPGCEYFLLPMPYVKLQEAAVDGPVTIIVVGKEQSTAIIVRSIGEPHEVDLPRASEKALRELYGELDDALGALPNPGPVMKKMRYILSDLWDILVQPIVHALQDILLVPIGSRIWWYPTSWTSFLPLHAAGSYKNGEPNVPDLYISSYTPTLQALRRSRSRLSSSSDSSTGTLIVSQPQTPGQIELPCVDEEVRIVSRLAPNASIISDDEGTKQRVLKELGNHSWIHLACHGDSDPSDPFKSHFALHDGPLSLQDIIANDLPSADFAFLSACHSAAQDRTLPDEGLALAGGMHFAGFKSVVGTLWGMADDDAPTLARKFYKGLAERSGDGKPFDCTKTAEALHEAVQGLRKKKVPLFRWVNLVHYGI